MIENRVGPPPQCSTSETPSTEGADGDADWVATEAGVGTAPVADGDSIMEGAVVGGTDAQPPTSANVAMQATRLA